MNMSHSRGALALAALLSGCALTPAQVLESAPLATTTIKAGLPALTPCLLSGMDDIHGAWTTSHRPEPGGTAATFRLHGHADTGTIAVVRARRIGERTEVAVHITESMIPRQPMADKIKGIAEGCDTR